MWRVHVTVNHTRENTDGSTAGNPAKRKTEFASMLPGLRGARFPVDEVQTLPPDPLATVRYSCVFWADHLRNSNFDIDALQCNTLDMIQTFLEQK